MLELKTVFALLSISILFNIYLTFFNRYIDLYSVTRAQYTHKISPGVGGGGQSSLNIPNGG